MTANKPTAQEIKKQIRKLAVAAPDAAKLNEILVKLANHQAVVRMLGQVFPGAAEEDLRRTLADGAALFQSLESWAEPAESKKILSAVAASGDEGTASRAPLSDYSDPTVLNQYDRVKVHIDGASKGNPGPASLGVVIKDVEGATLFEDGRCLGVMTNNAAEYHALIHALTVLVDHGRPETFVFADSLLVVNQMNLEWRVKHPDIKPLFTRAQQLKRRLPRFQIVHVTRDKNTRADKVANLALKQARDAAAAKVTP